MELPYAESESDCVSSWRRIHGNNEQTWVAVVETGSYYTAIAYDVDPVDMEPVAADIIAYTPTVDGATERARRWMETHAKGVAEGDGDRGGIAGALVGGLRKLNEYGSEQIDQIQDQQRQKEES